MTVSFGATGAIGFFGGCGLISHAELAEDNFQRTEIGERGLEEIETDKGREPKPISALIISQQQAGQDERAGKSANNCLHFHG